MINAQQPMFPAIKPSPRFGRLADGNEVGVIRQQAQTQFPGAKVDDKFCYTWDFSKKPSTAREMLRLLTERMVDVQDDSFDINEKIIQEPEGKQTVEVYSLIHVEPGDDLSKQAQSAKDHYAKANPFNGGASLQFDVAQVPPSSLLTRQVIDVAKAKTLINQDGTKG